MSTPTSAGVSMFVPYGSALQGPQYPTPQHQQYPYGHLQQQSVDPLAAVDSDAGGYRSPAVTTTANSLFQFPPDSPTASAISLPPNSFYSPSPSLLLHWLQPYQPAPNAGILPPDGVTQAQVSSLQTLSSTARPSRVQGHFNSNHAYQDTINFSQNDDLFPSLFRPYGSCTPIMATASTTATTLTGGFGADASNHPARKRRRSREPDWGTFYRNGLPKEIIIIEDSPEPQANTSRKLLNVNHSSTIGTTDPNTTSKRRVQEGAGSGYHVEHLASHIPTPLHNGGTPISSNGRADSTLQTNTTAPTSLSSNGRPEETSAPLKRKRSARQPNVVPAAKRRASDRLRQPSFAYKPPSLPLKKIAEVQVRVIQDTYNKAVKVDDDDGHYIVVPDTELTDKYEITRLLGQGTFGKVVQARDRKRNTAVAVKIIRSVQKYRDASKIELRVLATLKANDEENRNRCIHLRDCFDYRGHVCIVMDLLGQSIFDFLKGNGFVPFPNSQIQNFAKQLFTSVAFLHDLNLIHTDLKPENILLMEDHYQTFTYNRKIPSSSTSISRQATQRRVLLNTEIRLIDFGSATFQDEYHSSVVSTRHYRAPEIILGLGWSFPCDIWSIGCILIEFFTGDALFQTHDNLEHLAMMEAVVGTRINSYLVQSVNKISNRNSTNPNAASKYFKRLKLDFPRAETTRGSRRFVKAMKRLEEIIPVHNTFFKSFLDLLRKIFVYDPANRITAKEALKHPWFMETGQQDDGTEAAKIRQEKIRLELERLHQHNGYRGQPA